LGGGKRPQPRQGRASKRDGERRRRGAKRKETELAERIRGEEREKDGGGCGANAGGARIGPSSRKDRKPRVGIVVWETTPDDQTILKQVKGGNIFPLGGEREKKRKGRLGQ